MNEKDEKAFSAKQQWVIDNILSILEEHRTEINELRKEVAKWEIKEREKGSQSL
jgi:hypothetical protein